MFWRRFFSHFVEELAPPDLIGHLQAPHVVKSNFSLPGLDSLSWLHGVSPCFPLRGEQIVIIHEPSKFYELLVQKSSEARRRIVLASLYLGTGQLESKIVQSLRTNLQNNAALQVNVLLDFTRGTRGELNSRSMLLPLVKEFDKNVQLSMYHTPDLRGMTKRFAPPRWNELLGLQHMKVYLFDDTVLISGANLSNDYFTNRQDRYIIIEDKSLADFYAQLVSRVQEFSLVVQQNQELALHSGWKLLPYEGIKAEFIASARRKITDFMQDVYQTQQLLKPQADADTWIFPLIEMGQIGIHHDSIVTKRLLSSAVEGSRLKLATGYFNLTQDYMDIITHNCKAQCSILMAHPNANGFQGAKGPAGSIPAAYTQIAKSFYENLLRKKQASRVNFFEYEQPGWTYHAKGLWYYLPNAPHPCLTVIGSSNFGERSVHRDLESQVCLVTTNKSLSASLHLEADRLYSSAKSAENAIVSRAIPHWVRAVVKIFRNFF